MNQDSENFDSLRQLLALKRHETPPPGYFDRLPRDIKARIRAGEKGGAVGVDLPWFQRLLGAFDIKPVFAGAFGMAVCSFLISGVVSSESTTVADASGLPNRDGNSGGPLATASPMLASSASVADLIGSNTNSSVTGSASLFDQFQLQTEPVAYTIPIGH